MQEKNAGTDRTIPLLVLAAGLILVIIVAIILCGSNPGLFSKHPVTGNAVKPVQKPLTSVRIEASPQRYSPLMSSTIGIGLTPNVTGFGIPDARYEWNTSFGRFVDWNAPGYTVAEQGQSAVSSGEKIYWSFGAIPDSLQQPVVITLAAKDLKTGQLLGTSRMTLSWESNNSFVRVQKIE